MTELGKGSFATVYRVEVDGRPYALKRLNLGHNPIETIAEITLLSSLSHPALLPLHSVTYEDGHANLLLPLGTSLLTHLDDPFLHRLGYLYDLLTALEFLHRSQVLHRDLKPDNVIIIAGKAYLADLGVSIHHCGQLKGSVVQSPYEAPEIDRTTTANYGPETDMWSLGKLLQGLFTGVERRSLPVLQTVYRGCYQLNPTARLTARAALGLLFPDQPIPVGENRALSLPPRLLPPIMRKLVSERLLWLQGRKVNAGVTTRTALALLERFYARQQIRKDRIMKYAYAAYFIASCLVDAQVINYKWFVHVGPFKVEQLERAILLILQQLSGQLYLHPLRARRHSL